MNFLVLILTVYNLAILDKFEVCLIFSLEHILGDGEYLVYGLERLQANEPEYLADIENIFVFVDQVLKASETKQRLRMVVVFGLLVGVLAISMSELQVRVYCRRRLRLMDLDFRRDAGLEGGLVKLPV